MKSLVKSLEVILVAVNGGDVKKLLAMQEEDHDDDPDSPDLQVDDANVW